MTSFTGENSSDRSLQTEAQTEVHRQKQQTEAQADSTDRSTLVQKTADRRWLLRSLPTGSEIQKAATSITTGQTNIPVQAGSERTLHQLCLCVLCFSRHCVISAWTCVYHRVITSQHFSLNSKSSQNNKTIKHTSCKTSQTQYVYMYKHVSTADERVKHTSCCWSHKYKDQTKVYF